PSRVDRSASSLQDDPGAPSVTRPGDPWIAAMRRGDFAAAWAICDTVLRRRIAAGADFRDRVA
ncbi:MAG TPA: hypothetical protein VM782_12185, partial [Stellaceae bacterium]|nr:hypothetical protein [Stellaceae bacterium]